MGSRGYPARCTRSELPAKPCVRVFQVHSVSIIAAVISIESAGLLNIADLYLTLASLSIAGILKVASWAMVMCV